MPNIKKEIDSLRAKIARLEKEQKKAEQQAKALAAVQGQIDKLLKENGLNLEAYIRSQYTQISRVFAKIEREKSSLATTPKKQAGKKKSVARKHRAGSKKPSLSIKIPAGKYAHVPTAPDRVFEVKEKGPRPKLLKTYAEKVGLEVFFEQCRLEG
jgi:septal ring factor EnvC (AmiA/AmiB activator)